MSTTSYVIALDGPAGAGKSTVAKRVAEQLGYALVDTGAIYRSVTLLALRGGIDIDDGARLGDVARTLAEKLRFSMKAGKNTTWVGDEDVSAAIRTSEVSTASSSVSRHPEVRSALLELQRTLGRRPPGAVLEGRDIGTVVFPDADVKIFITASAEERAKRRVKELHERGSSEDYAKVLEQIRTRDKQDSERALAPLKSAEGSAIVDTSGKSVDDVVKEIIGLIRHTLEK